MTESNQSQTSHNQFNIRRIRFPVRVVMDWGSGLSLLDAFDANGQCIARMNSVATHEDVQVITNAAHQSQFLIKHQNKPVEGDYYYDLLAHQQSTNSNISLTSNTIDQFVPSMALGCGKTSWAFLFERLSLDVHRNGQIVYRIVDSNILARLMRNAIQILDDDDNEGLLPAWLNTPSFVMRNQRKQKVAIIKRPITLREDAFTIEMSADMLATVPIHYHGLVWCALLDHCYIQASIEADRY